MPDRGVCAAVAMPVVTGIIGIAAKFKYGPLKSVSPYSVFLKCLSAA